MQARDCANDPWRCQAEIARAVKYDTSASELPTQTGTCSKAHSENGIQARTVRGPVADDQICFLPVELRDDLLRRLEARNVSLHTETSPRLRSRQCEVFCARGAAWVALSLATKKPRRCRELCIAKQLRVTCSWMMPSICAIGCRSTETILGRFALPAATAGRYICLLRT